MRGRADRPSDNLLLASYGADTPGRLIAVDSRGKPRWRLETATYPVAAVAP
jgi:hypothetical protein